MAVPYTYGSARVESSIARTLAVLRACAIYDTANRNTASSRWTERTVCKTVWPILNRRVGKPLYYLVY